MDKDRIDLFQVWKITNMKRTPIRIGVHLWGILSKHDLVESVEKAYSDSQKQVKTTTVKSRFGLAMIDALKKCLLLLPIETHTSIEVADDINTLVYDVILQQDNFKVNAKYLDFERCHRGGECAFVTD
jgi:hypothetical protein